MPSAVILAQKKCEECVKVGCPAEGKTGGKLAGVLIKDAWIVASLGKAFFRMGNIVFSMSAGDTLVRLVPSTDTDFKSLSEAAAIVLTEAVTLDELKERLQDEMKKNAE